MTLTPIHDEPIIDAMAWRGQDFAGKQDITIRLSARNVAVKRVPSPSGVSA